MSQNGHAGSNPISADSNAARRPGPDFSCDRALWEERIALRDALAAADLAGRHVESNRTLAKLQAVNDKLFRRRREISGPPARERERFSYTIPLIDAESKRPFGYAIADETGVHTPPEFVRPLPTNSAGRARLRAVEPTKEAKEKALRSWQAGGHRGRPCCPGCRARTELIYLEFRNAEPGDRFRTHPILAVCDATALALLHRARREVFGPTTLVQRIPWPCSVPVPEMVLEAPEVASTPEPAPGPGRGGWRGRAASLRALERSRGARAARRPHSLSAEPALAPLI